ncbi:hypothetical protein DRP04_12335 [Archaeoglobales archaeon]|nr:MAG: hypothetical protein DRP04_12335 [Archaeoglobales archaeon]
MSFTSAYNEKMFLRHAVTVKDKLELTWCLLAETFKDLEDAYFKRRVDDANYKKAYSSLETLWNLLMKLQIYYDSSIERYSLLSSEFTIAIMQIRRMIKEMRAKLQLDDISAIGVVMASE